MKTGCSMQMHKRPRKLKPLTGVRAELVRRGIPTKIVRDMDWENIQSALATLRAKAPPPPTP